MECRSDFSVDISQSTTHTQAIRWITNYNLLKSFINHLAPILTGNLKHKDLMGQVVSSQAYDDDRNDPTDEHHMEAGVENQSVASEEEVTEKN